MKLLEILQKELTEFPEGMLYAVQDDDGEVKFGKHSHPTLSENGVWQRRENGKNLAIPRLELAEDWDSAIVTKDMWEKDRVKQIIVNVADLTIEEKRRVNEALAKIKYVEKCNPLHWGDVTTMYGPSIRGENVGFDHYYVKPTHTPQQVLEMAGMEPRADQHTPLVDKVTITDSSGRIIFDGTLESISTFIKSRASTGALPSSAFTVKTDENGVAVMATDRKVRKDFDPKQPISVDVSSCTHREKCEVQQAFVDVGITWPSGGIGRESEVASFRYLDAVLYTNSTAEGACSEHLMFGTSPRTDSISHQQFLDLVYEPEQQGHVHADLTAQYASIAATAEDPWNYFEIFHRFEGKEAWITLQEGQIFKKDSKYRRKPTTHIVNGVEIPDLRVTPELGDKYYLADPTTSELTELHTFVMDMEKLWIERGLTYQNTEEGKQAAILHSKAMLGIA